MRTAPIRVFQAMAEVEAITWPGLHGSMAFECRLTRDPVASGCPEDCTASARTGTGWQPLALVRR